MKCARANYTGCDRFEESVDLESEARGNKGVNEFLAGVCVTSLMSTSLE